MRIDFSTSSNPGTVPQEGDGRLINGMAEKTGDKVKWIRQPGVVEFATSEGVGFRGMALAPDGAIYAAYNEVLHKVPTPAGGAMTLMAGALPGSGKVRFAFNQRAAPLPAPDFVVVAPPNGAFVFTDRTTVSGYPDIDLPGSVIDVCFGLGFFFFITAAGTCYASDINSTAVTASQFTSAQAKPDGLLRCLYFNDQLYLLGTDSIEVWGKPLNQSLFPFNLVTVIPRGIAGPDCVTGTENGIDLGLIIISKNDQVMRISGYSPERISNPDVERDIAAITNKTTIQMTSFVSEGHMFVKVRTPAWCWLYDLTTQCWIERTSYLTLPVPAGATRTTDTSRTLQVISAYDAWIVGDSDSGNLGKINATVFKEYGKPFIWEIWSKRSEPMPYRAVIGPAYFNFVPGQGKVMGTTEQERNPRLNISWSDDGGLSWVPFRLASLHRQGITAPIAAKVNLTGSTGGYGRIWRLRISDPVYVCFSGGDMPKVGRRAVA